MSKSYDNTIPLFSSRAQLQKLIGGIVTDSRAPGEPKDVEGSALFQIYQAFATPNETAALRQQYADGIAWGAAKELLLEHVDAVIAPMRAQYEALMADPERIEATLLAGAERARSLATPFLRELRNAAGLRVDHVDGLRDPKEYLDGKFYFKLVDADGRLLLQSTGFDAPKEAGQAIAALKRDGLAALAGQHLPVEGVAESEVGAALTALAEAAA